MFLEFPVISNIIAKLRSFLGVKFLPKEVSTLIHSLLDFNDTFLRKAFEVDGIDAGPHEKGEVLAEVYPGLPQHSANEVFFADKKKRSGGIQSMPQRLSGSKWYYWGAWAYHMYAWHN